MDEASNFLLGHGLPVLFSIVLLEQLGLPLPAILFLLIAGGLSVTREFDLLRLIETAVLACLIADAFWFYLGRLRGSRLLGLICRLSLEPDSCVRRTQDTFNRYGLPGVIVAKFLPGIGMIMPPLAGMSGLNAIQFLFFDMVGSFLYCSTYILLGYLLSSKVTVIAAAITRTGGDALGGLVALISAYVVYKYWQRRRLLRALRMARITVPELRRQLDAGENPKILDLRSLSELELDPSTILGAIHLSPEDLVKYHDRLPRDRDIVIYCSCPNEISSARAASLLHRRGFTRVRPLEGGIDAWRASSGPMQTWPGVQTHPADNVVDSKEQRTPVERKASDSADSKNIPTI